MSRLPLVPATLSVLALAALAGGACATPPRGDIIDPERRDVATAVLAYQWKTVVHNQVAAHLPQEFASAAARSGDLYVGSHGGELVALRSDDGDVLWRRKVGSMSSRPLVDDPRLYVGTDEGSMVALNAFDGSVRWKYSTRGAVAQPPILVGDLLVFSNDADHVYALDRDSGQFRWQYERETPEEFTMRGHSGVAADGDRVFAGFSDGHVVALSATTGDVLWVRSLAGEAEKFVDVDSTPIVHQGVLYAASISGGLYALDASDGTEKWRLDVKGAGSVTVDDDHLYFAAADEGLFALDRSGQVLWRQGLRGAGDPARPVVQGPYLFLSTSEDGLLIVDKRSGDLAQSFDPGPGISSEPTINDGRLFVLSNGGVLYGMTVRL